MPTVLKGKEAYFERAFEVLADDGYEALNIGRLCGALGVTSGSFYHHFGSWDGFVHALLAYEQNRQVSALKRQDFGTGGAQTDVATLLNLTIGLNHRAEAALRAWSLNNAVVRERMAQIDQSRHRTVFNVVHEIVGDRNKATALTDLGMAILIGYQHMTVAGQVTEAERLFQEYVVLVLGNHPVD